jgi:iron complex transport system substrate-binding protein
MNIKKFTLVVAMIIIAAALIPGCIESNENGDNENKEPPTPITEVLEFNQSKIVTVDDINYNFTVKKIENSTVILALNSDDLLIMLKLDQPDETDTDLDGVNDLELNLTEISGSKVTIMFKSTGSASKYRYITDDMGENVKVPKKVNKIVSMAPSITEILFALNVGDKLVGRDQASNFPATAQDIDIVATYEGVDIEMLLVKEPDIIIMDKSLDFYDTNYNKMKDYGLNVFRLYPRTIEDVMDNIELIGKVTNTETTAHQLVDGLETRIDTVKTRETLKPTVLYVIYYDGTSSPWVGTSSTFSGDLIITAGGKVAVEDEMGIAIQTTVEDIISLNPDIIFTSQDDEWPTPSHDAILNDEALQNVNAVKNNLVIDVNADLVDRPGPRIVDGLELFSDYIAI